MAPEDDFPTKPQRSAYSPEDDNVVYRFRSLPSQVAAAGARLEQHFYSVGPRAQEILCRIAERLAKGAKQYGGDFDDKPRDWNAEALEEMLDCSVYLTMAAMKQEEAKAADKARAEAANRGSSRETFPPLQDAGRLDPRDGGA